MNETEVTREGLRGTRPGREAVSAMLQGADGARSGRPGRRTRRRAEQPMVPEASFRSYYGQPIINRPVWRPLDIAGYFFLGGLAGAGSVVAAAAQLTGRRQLARSLKLGSAVAAGLSVTALVHDLGRPARFLHMLRTVKPTSPMSVGSWVLAGYGPAVTMAAVSDLAGAAPALGAVSTAAAAALGPVLSTYTAALIANTAVPAWHDAHRDLPFVFGASALASAAGLGLLTAPLAEAAPVRVLGAGAGAAELVLENVMQRRVGLSSQAFSEGKAKPLLLAARAAMATGAVTALAGRRSRLLSAAAGTCLLVGSALTRFAVFEAGLASARDPRYTVEPQRERLAASAS